MSWFLSVGCSPSRTKYKRPFFLQEEISLVNLTLEKGEYYYTCLFWLRVFNYGAIYCIHSNNINSIHHFSFENNNRLSELESKAADLPRLQSRLAAAEEARATAVAAAQAQAIDFDATKRALTAELAAKSQALQSLLQSLDTRQRYEALLAEHEQG